ALKELGAICKNLQSAEKLLVLEAAAQGSSVGINVGEVVISAERSFLLEAAMGLKRGEKIEEVVQLKNRISEWLGEGTRLIRNEAGDSIFLSKDGLRRVRFDFNRPYPHNNPHAHVECKIGVGWQ